MRGPPAPASSSPRARRPEVDRDRWIRDDTAAVLAACDRVFGAVLLTLAAIATVCWHLGRTGALTVVLVWVFPAFNLAVSQLGRSRRRRAELVRVAINAPMLIAIHACSDGVMSGLWVPALIAVAGGALVLPSLTRDVRWGHAHTLLIVVELVVAAALGDRPVVPTIWRALSVALVGFILAVTMRRLGESLIAARTSRAEAESHKRELERSLAQLDERRRGLRLVLDSVAQGFVTIDLRGAITSERSAILDRWFGAPAGDTTFVDLVARHDPAVACWLALGLDGLREDLMPREVCLDQLPRRLVAGGRTLELTYRPIDGDDGRLLVVASDVSEHLERARAEGAERELIVLFQRITADRAGFDEFLDEASALVSSLASAGDPGHERRALHTLKGTCAVYGLDGFAGRCHQLEQDVADTGGALTDEQRGELTQAWAAQLAQVQRLVGAARRATIELEPRELADALERGRRGEASRELTALLAGWTLEPARRRLERLAIHASALARRLGKGDLDVEVIADDVRLDPARWTPFWTALVHAVTNAIDHGIEDAEVRARAGKPARPRLELSALRAGGELIVRISDDGAGVDWARIAARARAAGLPADTPAELTRALFADGVTTRAAASETSGRGVGLAALAAVVAALGGHLEVDSRPAAGTTLACRFADGDGPRRAARTTAPPARALA